MTDETSTSFQIPEAYYTTLFEALAGNNALLQTDAPRFTILAASPSYIQQTGTSKEAMIGHGIFEAFPGSTDPQNTGAADLLASLNHVLQHKELHQLPVRYDTVDEDGRFVERHWIASNKPVFSPNGEVAYIIHTGEEITDGVMAKKREAQLDGIEKAYNLFMQVPAIISITKGPEHIVELANEGAMKLWGRGAEIIGKPVLKAIPEVQRQGVIERFTEVLETGKPFLGSEVPVVTYRTGAKEELYFDVVYQPYYEKGSNKPSGVFALSHEVTELVKAKRKVEESEAKLRSLIEEAPIATCLFVGREMVIEVANEAMIQVWGKGPGVMGKPLAEALPELSGQHFLPLLDELFTTGNTYSAKAGCADFVVDGRLQTFYFDYDFKPLRTADGTVYAILDTMVDVTVQVLAKKALEENERNLRNMILQAPMAICIFRGPRFVIEIANEKMFELWGKSPEQVISKPLFEGIPEATNQGYEELMTNVLTTGQTFSASELPVTLPRNGVVQTVFINFTYEPLREKDGSISGIMTVATDVTEQVTARRKVEESEAKLKSLIAAAPIAIGLFIGRDLVIENPNQQFIDILGKGPDIAGKRLTHIMPELIEHGQPYLKILDDVFTSGKMYQSLGDPVNIVRNGVMHNGFYNIYYVPLFDAEGKVYGIMDIATDVTEQIASRKSLEESEARFRKLADESPIFVFIIDADPLAPVSYWNKTWLDYTGQTAEEAFGSAWNGIIHPDDVPIVMEHYAAAFGPQKSYFIPAVRVKRHDGVYRWHSFKGNPRYLPGGAFSGYVGVGSDIHEQKVTEEGLEDIVVTRTEELQRMNKELQRSNAHLEEFAHAASHDLKEPIRKITFFTHQLKTQLTAHLQESELRSFTRIENAAERMGNLIDDLLLYSHVSQKPHETEAVDLNVKVQRVLEDLELDIGEKNAIVQVGELPLVQGYRRQLQQLFQNLISNALKYSKADEKPVITITSENETIDGKRFYVIKVQDNGIGFEQVYADRIFQMFSRLHGKSEYSGTGVGLSIVKKVVENHNGFIRVESVVGRGSTFEIYLPA